MGNGIKKPGVYVYRFVMVGMSTLFFYSATMGISCAA